MNHHSNHIIHFRSDTRLCRRAKRHRCRAALSAAHPLYAPERVAEMCRARKWLRRCARKAVRARLQVATAGHTWQHVATASGHSERKEMLQAEASGRCKARLEKRVRAERRRRLKAEGENDVAKSGES